MCDPTCSEIDVENSDYQKQFQFQCKLKMILFCFVLMFLKLIIQYTFFVSGGEEVLENETILKLINLKEKYSRTYNDEDCWL